MGDTSHLTVVDPCQIAMHRMILQVGMKGNVNLRIDISESKLVKLAYLTLTIIFIKCGNQVKWRETNMGRVFKGEVTKTNS